MVRVIDVCCHGGDDEVSKAVRALEHVCRASVYVIVKSGYVVCTPVTAMAIGVFSYI